MGGSRLSQRKSIVRSFAKYQDPPREGRMAIHIAWREFIGTLGGLAVTAAARRLREGSRLTLRTSHNTINGGRVGRRSFIPDKSC
jgi:hypothetical protein